MGSTALQLIQAATGEMGLTIPTVVTGSQNQDSMQLMALLNAVGSELCRKHPWQALDIEYRFTTQYLQTTGTTVDGSAVVTALGSTTGLDATYMAVGTGVPQDCYVVSVDSATQVTLNQALTESGTGATITFCKTKYTMPAAFDRDVPTTQWDKTRHWQMVGPATPQQWQLLKSGFIATGPRITWRRIGGYFEIWPTVSANEYLGFEYISKYWAVNGTTSAAQATFAADADTCIYPDRLMILGLKLKYWQVKGFDTTAFATEFNEELSNAKAADGGNGMLSFAPRMSAILVNMGNVPDSGYGQ